jgi:anti-anti-sigma factor
MQWDLIEQAADIVMEPLKDQEVPMVVVDLSDVSYFGSVFLALLLRCHKFVRKAGGEMVLCGASPTASELLRITALDTIWAIYDVVRPIQRCRMRCLLPGAIRKRQGVFNQRI